MTQVNNFLETYRLFNNEFVFKGVPIREYILTEIDKVQSALKQMDEEKKINPEVAAMEDKRELKGVRIPAALHRTFSKEE